jgi:hypothetical protein
MLGHKVKEHPQFQEILFTLLFWKKQKHPSTIPIATEPDALRGSNDADNTSQ